MKSRHKLAWWAIAATLLPALVYAGCGVCGPAPAADAKKACGAACEKACCAAPAEEVAEITTAALKTLLQADAAIVLDARSGKWDDGKRVPGAKSLSPKATAEEAAKLIPSKEALVVTYCNSTKCPASSMLAKRLSELGYKNILEYPVGIAGWIEDGIEVEQSR